MTFCEVDYHVICPIYKKGGDYIAFYAILNHALMVI